MHRRTYLRPEQREAQVELAQPIARAERLTAEQVQTIVGHGGIGHGAHVRQQLAEAYVQPSQRRRRQRPAEGARAAQGYGGGGGVVAGTARAVVGPQRRADRVQQRALVVAHTTV